MVVMFFFLIYTQKREVTSFAGFLVCISQRTAVVKTAIDSKQLFKSRSGIPGGQIQWTQCLMLNLTK